MIARFLFLLILLFVTPALANARGIEPELVAAGPAEPGGEVELAIHMRTKPGWHGYWLNPGDAGLPMHIDWQLPAGASLGPLRYPVPGRLTIGGLMNYVYEDDYAILTRLKVPANARGTVPLRAKARWLACTDKVCVPEQGELALDIPVRGGGHGNARFDAWERSLPHPIASASHFEMKPDRLEVAVPIPSSVTLGEPYFYPAVDGQVDYGAPQSFRRSGDFVIAELQRPPGKALPTEVSGVLALGDGRGLEISATPGAVPSGGHAIGGLGGQAILYAVLGAILGGMLLNLMPCVFPILALKALHLARSGRDAASARRDSLGYAAGAIVGTGLLGGVLLAIRAGGSAAGWAFQLQDPRTTVLLLLLATTITLNLLRTFELPVLGGETNATGSFGTGALAAFVATPCAGPFLGAALGTALLLPAIGSVAVFAALGLGLALPFVAVAFVPSLRRLLPTPGAWMARLQRFLALPMAATAVGCLWLLWRQGGMPALGAGLIAVAALVLLLVWTGWRQRSGEPNGIAALVAIAVLAGSAAAIVPARDPAAARVPLGASAWGEEAVQRELADGHPVFVYFTADWCLTCKVNEASSIERGETREAFGKAGVKVLVGDWTNGDPDITRFLESRGRAAVPLYLWYQPGKAEPEELPQVLTPGMLVERAKAAR